MSKFYLVLVGVNTANVLGSVHLKSVGGGGGKQGGGHSNSILDLGGGASKFRTEFGRGSCKFRIRGKKSATLHFRIIIYLLNNQINYFIFIFLFLFLYNTQQEPLSGIASRGGEG